MSLPPFFDSNNCESDLAKRILHIRFQILVYSPNFTKKNFGILSQFNKINLGILSRFNKRKTFLCKNHHKNDLH